jgi:hypothetical protein
MVFFIFVDAFVVSISLRDPLGLRRHITVEDFLFCFLSVDTNLPYRHTPHSGSRMPRW